ncbi:glycosyltransferase family 4 protein, partial [bacterium]|nr:glycosyltransferase family 4 protein [bacterium]
HHVVGSDLMASHYKKILGKRMYYPLVLPNWTDLEMFNPEKYDREKLRSKFGYKLKDKVIFFLHGMEKGKGPQFLPNIVKGIASTRKDVKFLFVGEGSLRKGVQKEIEDMGFSPITHFTGEVPHFDIPEYYAVSDIFIMPSLFEAFSRCLLEAMAMGLPFVASDGGCGGTFAYTPLEQHPYIVSIPDIDRFPHLVLKILEDEDSRKKLSSINLQFVKEYSFDKAIKRFEDSILK